MRIRQKLIEIAIKEERKGKRVKVGRGWVRIDGKWWNWVEEEERLKDERGVCWTEEREAYEKGKDLGEEEEREKRMKN